jgi:hypothetical protein
VAARIPPTAPTPPAPPPAAPPPVPDPPAPPPPAPIPDDIGFLWVKVIPDQENDCLVGATVDVVVAGSVVQSAIQAAPVPNDPCDYWSDGGGLFFRNLPITQVTLRATASGYVTQEMAARPCTGRTRGADLSAADKVTDVTPCCVRQRDRSGVVSRQVSTIVHRFRRPRAAAARRLRQRLRVPPLSDSRQGRASRIVISPVRSALGGILPGIPRSPHARCDAISSRRVPPTRIPSTP